MQYFSYAKHEKTLENTLEFINSNQNTDLISLPIYYFKNGKVERITTVANNENGWWYVNNGRVVKGTNFVNLRDAGDPIEVGREYDKAGADELVFLDITASSDALTSDKALFIEA